MGIDLTDNDESRFYSIPDGPDLTFPDGDWFLSIWTVFEQDGPNTFQYLVSNNGFGAANSFNLLANDFELNWRIVTDTSAIMASSESFDDTPKLIVAQRSGSNLQLWICPAHGTAIKRAEDTSYTDGAIDGGNFIIGVRADFPTLRGYREKFGDLVKGNVALTQSQIELLARGVPPTLVTDPANLVTWFHFREATAAVVDVIGGNVATRNGTGLLTVEHFPFIGNPYSFIPEAAPPVTGNEGAAMYHHLQNMGVY